MKHRIITIIALLAVMVALTGLSSAISTGWQKDGKEQDPIPMKNGEKSDIDLRIHNLRPWDNQTTVNVTVVFLQCVNENCDPSDISLEVLKKQINIREVPEFVENGVARVNLHVPLDRKPGTRYSFAGAVEPFLQPLEVIQASLTVLLVGANITGTKFNDLDGNGIRGTTEPGLPGWTINLKNETGAIVATTQTDANGNYKFSNVRGNFTVEEVVQPGWIQTAPTPIPPGTYNVTVDAQDVTGKDFGNRKSLNISGMKCQDSPDFDGICGTNEPGLANWTIVLKNSTTGAIVATNKTDSNGNYKFTNLSPGNYTVEEVLKSGWEQTGPKPVPPGNYSVTLSVNDVNGLNFANKPIEEKPGKCIGWGNLEKPDAKFNIFAFTPNNFSGVQGTVKYEQEGMSIESTKIESVNSSSDMTTCTIKGLASVNGGAPVPFIVEVEDHGTPGRGLDKFGIAADPFSRPEELLTFGNIKIVR